MPLSATEKILSDQYEGHEYRIQTIEVAISALANDVRPALARMEVGIDHLHEKIDHVQEDVETTKARLSDGHRTFTDHNYRLKTLETHTHERKAQRKSMAKWIAGVCASIFVALVISLIGM